MLVALGTPNYVIPPRSLIEFLKLTWTCASRLSRNKIKFPVSLTIDLKVFFYQSRQISVSAHAFFWKYTSTSLSQDAFSTTLNLFPFPQKIITRFGCCPVGRKQKFKVQKCLLSLCLVVSSTVSSFDFSFFFFFFDLLPICSYVLLVSLAIGRGDWSALKRCRGRYLPHFLS